MIRISTLRRHVATVAHRLGPLWWYAGLMFLCTRLGDLVNLYIGMFVVPDTIPATDLGAVLPLMQLASVLVMPVSVVMGASRKYLNAYLVTGQEGKVKALLRDLLLAMAGFSIAAAFAVWWGREFIARRLALPTAQLLWLVLGLGLVNCWGAIAGSLAQGLKSFYRIVAGPIVGPLVRLLCTFLLLKRFLVGGYIASFLAAALAVTTLQMAGSLRFFRRNIEAADYRADMAGMFRYLGWFALVALFQNIDATVVVWVIRQRMAPVDSAGYYIAATFGRIPLYLGGAVLPFLFPLASERHERGERSDRMIIQAVTVVLAVGLAVSAGFAAFGADILRLRESWQTYLPCAPLIWRVGVTTTCMVACSCFFSHETACSRFSFLCYYVPLSAVMAGFLYGLNGLNWLRPYASESVLTHLATYARSLPFTVSFVMAYSAIAVACCGIHLIARRRGARMTDVGMKPGG